MAILKTLRFSSVRYFATAPKRTEAIAINNRHYPADEYTNVPRNIVSYLGRNIYLENKHPLSLLRQKIVDYFYSSFVTNRGHPEFSIYDRLDPVVSVKQNFDDLLVPKDHVSRAKSDCYYLNKETMLRAHMTAHQMELIKSGLDSFLMIGDVYRRDEIDSTHFPVFHQVDGVRTQTRDQLFQKQPDLKIFEPDSFVKADREPDALKQNCHTLEAVKLMEHHQKRALEGMVKYIFGPNIKYRWVDAYFPFTHPSWELEKGVHYFPGETKFYKEVKQRFGWRATSANFYCVRMNSEAVLGDGICEIMVMFNDQWLEVLGCGIVRNEILAEAGARERIAYAFGLGLERLAMALYQIPDIRLFWSRDTGFLSQFEGDDKTPVKYKPVSTFPQCYNDISFWLPEGVGLDDFSSNDFYDLVREVGGDIVEQVKLIDSFKHPKTRKCSLCYRITYRHMETTLTQKEVGEIHNKIRSAAKASLNIELRI